MNKRIVTGAAMLTIASGVMVATPAAMAAQSYKHLIYVNPHAARAGKTVKLSTGNDVYGITCRAKRAKVTSKAFTKAVTIRITAQSFGDDMYGKATIARVKPGRYKVSLTCAGYSRTQTATGTVVVLG